MRRLLSSLALVLTVCSCSSSSSTHTLTGNLTLTSAGDFPRLGIDNPSCAGTGGYDDITEGAEVTVRDDKDKLIGTGKLLLGFRVDDDHCTFKYTVTKIPSAKFYVVTVTHRGGVSYSAAEMAKNKWSIDTSIGSL